MERLDGELEQQLQALRDIAPDPRRVDEIVSATTAWRAWREETLRIDEAGDRPQPTVASWRVRATRCRPRRPARPAFRSGQRLSGARRGEQNESNHQAQARRRCAQGPQLRLSEALAQQTAISDILRVAAEFVDGSPGGSECRCPARSRSVAPMSRLHVRAGDMLRSVACTLPEMRRGPATRS